LTHYRDRPNLLEEAGDAGWSLLQLCNEFGVDFGELVQVTVKKLDERPREGRWPSSAHRIGAGYVEFLPAPSRSRPAIADHRGRAGPDAV